MPSWPRWPRVFLTHSISSGRHYRLINPHFAVFSNDSNRTQVLPFQFNQQYARSFAYQILIGLSTNFIGYGLAGLTRKFLVYPAYCLWPASLVTIALNSALHKENSIPVPGPFKKMYSASRYRFFMYAFAAMFVYFWFPNYIMQVLTYFSWMTWIAPNNHTLDVLAGFNAASVSVLAVVKMAGWPIC